MADRDNSRQGETLDAGLFAALAAALAPVEPPAGLRDRVLEGARATRERRELRTIRADEGWVEFMPGVRIKMLYRDEAGHARSFLARLDPGVALPAHEHMFTEECLVLEGEITMGEISIRAGDYHIAMQGAHHEALTTRTGALVFLRTGPGQHVPEPVSE